MKLNIACGEKQLEGFDNVDVSPDCQPDRVMDVLKFPWSYPDNSVSQIYCSHFLEHLDGELIPFMEECYRVLEPGGTAHFECPYYTSIRAWQDPTHKRALSEFSFHYYNAEWRKTQGVGHYKINTNFKVEEIRYHYPNGLQGMEEEELKWLREHAWNTVADFEIILRAIKDDIPGRAS